MARVLVLTASIGAGHDLPAELLADALRQRGAEVQVADGLVAAGRLAAAVVENGSQLDTRWGRALFDVEHFLLSRTRTGGALASALAAALGRRGLLALVARTRPDVVVSTYPGTTEVLARERLRGRLRLPLVSAITDLASLRFWAHRGVDVHLLTHPESEPEVRAIAGPATRVVAVRGFSAPAFYVAPDRAAARTALGLPADGAVIVVSGGGWAVGDLAGGARVAAALPGVAAVVVLCGSRPELRERLGAELHGVGGVQLWGFTDRMPELLAAADALVHSTAGLTVLEAQLRGCPVISYGWGGGHIRANNAAFAHHGLATVARSHAQLRAALAAAIATRPQPTWPKHAAMPEAADVVLELVGGR